MLWRKFRSPIDQRPEDLGLDITVVQNPGLMDIAPFSQYATWYHDLGYAYFVIDTPDYVSLYRREEAGVQSVSQIAWLLDSSLCLGEFEFEEGLFFSSFSIDDKHYSFLTSDAILELATGNCIRAYFNKSFASSEYLSMLEISFFKKQDDYEDHILDNYHEKSERLRDYLYTYYPYRLSSLETTAKLPQETQLLIYPTILPAIPLVRNILGFIVLDMVFKDHHLIIGDLSAPEAQEDLKKILIGLMPNEPYTLFSETDADICVYEELIVDNKTYKVVDGSTADGIVTYLKGRKNIQLQLKVYPPREQYSTTIFRALLTKDQLKRFGEDGFIDDLISNCVV